MSEGSGGADRRPGSRDGSDGNDTPDDSEHPVEGSSITERELEEIPVLAGNVIGGTALFALISYAQIMKEI